MIFWLFCFFFVLEEGKGMVLATFLFSIIVAGSFWGGKNCWVVDALGIPCCMNLMSYVSVVPLEKMLQNLYEFVTSPTLR